MNGRRWMLVGLVATALVACKGEGQASDPSEKGPNEQAQTLVGKGAPAPGSLPDLVPPIKPGEDPAKVLGTPAAEQDLGEPEGADGKVLAIARSVMTDPGDIPRLKVAVDGKKLDLPLKHTHVSAELTGFVSRVTVTQTYQNPFPEPIEAIYVFPLPENSAVDDMKMRIGERLIEAEIKKREEARRVYEEAKREGYTAALLEQERPNIFTQSVANIEPGKDIEVIIRYVQDLSYDAGEYEFVFPMVVGPRFIPGAPGGQEGTGWAKDTDRVPDASRITPPILGGGVRSGHDVSLELIIDRSMPVTDLEVPTHDVNVVESDGDMIVELKEHDNIPNRDFVMRYKVASELPKAAVYAHREKRGGFFSLVLQPPDLDIDDVVGRRELIFVVDISGSMHGVPLSLCKDAMREAITSLRPTDTFNVFTFAGRTAQAFEASRPANQTNVRLGLDFIAAASAGGGTNLGDAVAAALSPDVADGRNRYVFFMTDGYVGNENEIHGLAERFTQAQEAKGRRSKVFAMGVGSSVNRHLLDGLATAGKGLTVYATNREDPTRAVNKFYHYIDHAVLTDLRIDWGGLEIADVYPEVLPDLFASHPVILHGRYKSGGKATITIEGQRDGQTTRIPVDVDLPEQEPKNGALETLWARAKIGELQRQLWQGPVESVVEEITSLGIDYRIVTAYTSFVAVDRSKKVGDGDPKKVVQPVEAPEDVDMAMAAPTTAVVTAAPPPSPRHASAQMRLRSPTGAAPVMRELEAAEMPAPTSPKPFPAEVGGEGLGGGKLAATKSEEEKTPVPTDEAQIAANVRLVSSKVVSGALDADAVRRVAKLTLNALRQCYRQALAASPGTTGALTLKLKVDASGKVLSVEATHTTLGDAALGSCVTHRFQLALFPAAKGESIVTLELAFSASK